MGGAGVYAAKIVNELIKLGISVTVFTSAFNKLGSEIKNENLEIVRIPLSERIPFKALQFWLKLPRALNNFNQSFDLVHINSQSSYFFNILDIPHVLTIHHSVKDAIIANDKGLFFRILDLKGENNFLLPIVEKRAVNSVDKIIAVSEFTKKQIAKYYDVELDKIEVIYNGFDKDDLVSIDEDCLVKFKNDNFPNKKVLLFVGRVNDYRKGLDILLYSFRDILNSLDAVLIVIGGGNNQKMVELCKKLEISNNVIFMGNVDRIYIIKIL